MLKPNLLRASSPEKGVTTHPALVRVLSEMVRDVGARPVIADSPSLGPWILVAKTTGMAEVAKGTGAELLNLDRAVTVHTPSEFSFRILELAKEVFEVDCIINIPKLKTHSMTLLTLGVKNLFGCVPGFRKSSWHLKAGTDREFFAALLLEISLLIKPSLTVLDAIWGMEGNGPTSGNPRFVGRILASADPLALDRVVVEALGLEPDSLPTLRVARKRGLLPQATLIG
ncbi:MAG: (4Fe-4S)-binding protein, partial [Deltaproteobacteria bacterium]